MYKVINPNMILLAREARGFSQSTLGSMLRTGKAGISRLEHGEASVDEETLLALSQAMAFPPQFFLLPGEIMPVNLSYRKRKNVPAKLLTPIEAHINIIRRHVQLVTLAGEQQPPELPVYSVETGTHDRPAANTPGYIAAQLRKKWNVPVGPVDNMVTLLENHGIIISSFDFGTNRVDSRSILTDGHCPIIFLNKNLLGDRQRFSLAYELGHLIMHSFCIVPHQHDVNHEANLFAAAFLMPQQDIAADFAEGITLPLLGELKRKWKVSMIALLYRADDLGLLTPNQKRYMIQQFNNQKIRRREPPQLDVPPETPQLLRQLFAGIMKKAKLSLPQLCTLLATEHADYIKYYHA